jgi:hypothetical protein
MSFDIDLDEVDLEGCAYLVVQSHCWDLDSLSFYFLEPVSKAGLRCYQAAVLLWHQQFCMPGCVRNRNRPKLDMRSRFC